MTTPRLTRTDLWRTLCYTGGQWISSDDGQLIDVLNPATGERLAQVPALSSQQVEQSLQQAQQAFEHWRQSSPGLRSQLLRRWYQLMVEHREDLALVMTLEQGKPLAEARAEVDYAASYIDWFAEEAKRGYGEVIPANKPHQQLLAVPEPVGVSVAITPWNFPAAMITRKAGAALAARLRHGGQTFRADAAKRTGPRLAGAGGGAARRCLQCGHRGFGQAGRGIYRLLHR